jgi:DNA anti-recombination protein RmuC
VNALKELEELFASKDAEIERLTALNAKQNEQLNTAIMAIAELRAERTRKLEGLKATLDARLNNHLIEMKEGYDDSITGFNEAWDIMRETFAEKR